MFDIALRPLKDSMFDSVCKVVPNTITPLHITIAAFSCGAASCCAAAFQFSGVAVAFWVINRALDCLDGAVARQRGQASDLGGFLDLLGDFIVYSAIPICCATGFRTDLEASGLERRWIAVSFVEATFHINNFVLFFVAAITEKAKLREEAEPSSFAGKNSHSKATSKELTSLAMKPALVEGAESGIVFTMMLAMPQITESLCWILGVGVVVGTIQRVVWVVGALN